MSKKYYATLSVDSIDQLINNLDGYKQRMLTKNRTFVRRLADAGITVAESRRGEYGDLIQFTKKTKENSGEVFAVALRGKGTEITKEWYTSRAMDKTHSETIDPMLMAEFGSGFLANAQGVAGVGQGTLNKYGHAFDKHKAGWRWYDENGVEHRSRGEAPTYPMHGAYVEMVNDIERIAREVFSTR